jgi:hypothetical protein
MDATHQNRRRWYQFSVRTMFVLVTLACVGFGWWVHWSKEWIKQRHEAIDSGQFRGFRGAETPAPWALRPFGELGITRIYAG